MGFVMIDSTCDYFGFTYKMFMLINLNGLSLKSKETREHIFQ